MCRGCSRDLRESRLWPTHDSHQARTRTPERRTSRPDLCKVLYKLFSRRGRTAGLDMGASRQCSVLSVLAKFSIQLDTSTDQDTIYHKWASVKMTFKFHFLWSTLFWLEESVSAVYSDWLRSKSEANSCSWSAAEVWRRHQELLHLNLYSRGFYLCDFSLALDKWFCLNSQPCNCVWLGAVLDVCLVVVPAVEEDPHH